MRRTLAIVAVALGLAAMLVALAAVTAIPQLSLWLPSKLGY